MSGQRPVAPWDLDGTVLDPAGAITEGIAEALWACGFEAPENLERFAGPPIGESLRRFTDVPRGADPPRWSRADRSATSPGARNGHALSGVSGDPAELLHARGGAPGRGDPEAGAHRGGGLSKVRAGSTLRR
ncbi:hypothetical protein QJS66_02800 [Kocuria rhizophila]|nr:hypothetical protein QJS66_02800 [Kocuria rhizophila]